MPTNYLDERIAKSYEARWPELFEPAMVNPAVELRTKPGGDDLDVTVGDFATTRVDGTFTLAYLARNTIMNLTSQDAQVACFRNVAAHLEPGGRFVIEVGVPGLRRLPPGEIVRPFAVTRPTWASRSTTWPARSRARTTTGWSTAGWRPSRPRSATSGRPSWT